ncbi:4-hydroxy-2-oxovalerate aldolase DmpG [methanogenic archaeon ISO4-H5]|nr:4-hydroxy-2-oxovalerate aldolase DmpG [methanogenic archaeon ISO4-H5]
MDSINLLDCTLRDGGYINNWKFGRESIDYILRKLETSGIEYIEIGFIKGDSPDPDSTLFPDTDSINSVIPKPRSKNTKYVGMVDMSKPVPLERIKPYQPGGIDLIRVIFKQDKIDLGYEYAREITKLGYGVMIQLVSTDTYSDDELGHAVRKFNTLKPHSVYIVDSLGLLKRKDFMRMVYLVDHVLADGVCLGYHSHNNLQQARGNAESLVELGLKRDILIDACVFGMGRGAGNLNEELFADYLNENYNKSYRIEPMLEIIDECLMDIYRLHFWGYSVPFYLSAKNKVHPNYAKYYNDKGALTEKAFNELLKTIKPEDSHIFTEELAENYYKEYMRNYVDDRKALEDFATVINNREVLIIAPGENHLLQIDRVKKYFKEVKPIVISVSFEPTDIPTDYSFYGNMRKYNRLKNRGLRKLVTSNIRDPTDLVSFVFNYNSYLFEDPLIIDNSGLMILKILRAAGVKKVAIAGMDGYTELNKYKIFNARYDFTKIGVEELNSKISQAIADLRKDMEITFLTDTQYE